MAELVDAVDSKSTSSDRVPVRVRMEAPVKNNEHLVRFLFWLLRDDQQLYRGVFPA